jgi:drug/metabolite transporter (DMT)-like permease
MNGILLMLCADVAFALMAAAAKSIGGRIPAAEVVLIRSALSCTALFFFLKKSGVRLKGARPSILWARGIIGYAALQCYFWALPQLPLGTAVMLNYTAPIFAVVFSFLTLGEKPPMTVKILLPASFFGIYLLTAPEFAGNPQALFSGLVSGVLAGAVYVMIRKSRQSDPALLVVFYFTLSSVLGSGFLVWTRTGWVDPTPLEWVELMALTAASFLGQICLTHSLQKAPVWKVSPFGYLTPVLGALLGWYFWKESLNVKSVLGGLIVIACGAVMLRLFRPRDTAR